MNAKSSKKSEVTPRNLKLRHVHNRKDLSCDSKDSKAIIEKQKLHYLHCKEKLVCMKCSNYRKYILRTTAKHANECKDKDCKVDACGYLKVWLKNRPYENLLEKLCKIPILNQQTLERLIDVASFDMMVSLTSLFLIF